MGKAGERVGQRAVKRVAEQGDKGCTQACPHKMLQVVFSLVHNANEFSDASQEFLLQSIKLLTGQEALSQKDAQVREFFYRLCSRLLLLRWWA